MNILICDDEINEIKETEKICRKIVARWDIPATISVTTDSEKIQSYDPDILVLDVEMPKESGLEIKDRLARRGSRPYIIFVTNYEEHMPFAFNRNVIGFTMKPLKMEIMEKLLSKAMDLLSVDVWIEIEPGVRINSADVMMIYTDKGYTNIKTSNEKEYNNIRKSMKEWDEELTEKGFIRISEKILVNGKFIGEFKGDKITLVKGEEELCIVDEIKVSRRRRKEVYEQFLEYMERTAVYG